MSSKGWQYSENTQTLVGQQRKRLQDLDTGEIVEVDQITKRAYGSKSFWKVYLMDFLSILGIFDSKQLDVFIYILENTEQSNNTFIGTYNKIQKATGVSRPTVAKIMTKLQENKFIIKVQNGVWQVNPNIMLKGNDTKKQMLLSYYNDPMDEAAITKENSIVQEGTNYIGKIE